MITLAINASSKLNGTAKNNILYGSTFMFPMTIHINTNPTNQDRKVVCNNENFFEVMNIAAAKQKDQSPQITPLIGSEENTCPRIS